MQSYYYALVCSLLKRQQCKRAVRMNERVCQLRQHGKAEETSQGDRYGAALASKIHNHNYIPGIIRNYTGNYVHCIITNSMST